MLAVIPIIVCCALIPLAMGIVAVLGLSKKDKKPADPTEMVGHPVKRSMPKWDPPN